MYLVVLAERNADISAGEGDGWRGRRKKPFTVSGVRLRATRGVSFAR